MADIKIPRAYARGFCYALSAFGVNCIASSLDLAVGVLRFLVIKSYKDLIVWQKSMELAQEIYRLTGLFPAREQYGLVSQMRRASVSIPSNIAEGYGRRTQKEYKRFYSIAFGSGLELETQLLLSKRLALSPISKFDVSRELLGEVLRMLNVMTSKKMRN